MLKTVVIGLGNPLLSDDRAGIAVTQALERLLDGRTGADIRQLHAGGVRLMEAMEGYERAIIADSMITGGARPGSVRRASLSGPVLSGDTPGLNVASVHDMDLPTAIEAGRRIGLRLPDEITVYGIEADDVKTFGEALSPAVEEAVSRVAGMIYEELVSDPASGSDTEAG